MRNPNYVGIVFSEDDDDEKPRLCEKCLARGYRSKLGVKILEKGKEPEPDHFDWLQCYVCGDISPRYQAKYEQSVEPFAQTTDNPFDEGRGQVMGIPKRTTEAGKKSADKRKREKNRLHHKDPDIDREIHQYGEENVKVVYDSNP